jgi:hypothetical protein
MSTTMNSTTITTRPRALRVATALFAITVVFFLLAGLAIVIGQTVALAAGDATAARTWASALGPYAFGAAAAAGLLSFALTYGKAGGRV